MKLYIDIIKKLYIHIHITTCLSGQIRKMSAPDRGRF